MIELKKRVLCLAAALCLAASLLLVGCEQKETIRVFNWGEFIAEGVLEDFEEETGIQVIYSEYNTNEDMYNKLKTTSYDVIVPSDYMVQQLIEEDMLAELNFDNIPNYQYIDPQFQNTPYDPENKYSVPYMWCTLGILYDSEKVAEPITSMTAMWDPQYEGRMFMMDSMRDTIGITMKMLGYSVNSEDQAELDAAQAKLIEQRPMLLGYVTDEIKDKLISGEAYLGLAYSGEAGKAMEEKESLAYCVPEEGTIFSIDTLCVPKNAQNKEGGEKFINFMHKPDIAARNAEEMLYGIANTEGKKLLPEEITSDESLYPSDEVMARSELMAVSKEINEKNEAVWQAVMSAN